MRVLGMTIFAASAILLSCNSNNQQQEDRFVFEGERVLDTETGDEYYLRNLDTLTVVNIEGESNEIVVTEAPFSDSDELKTMISNYKGMLAERKEDILEDETSKIIHERKERFSGYSDDQLLEHFNTIHKEGAPYYQQMDVMAELVSRDVVLEIDVPRLMEIDTAQLDLSATYHQTE